ncbi:hypothetical protein NY08_3453 [Rhodococcus sp. B7740]|nr:hypothetical protein NY08_3453 [Rhodococcus sp. B7740]
MRPAEPLRAVQSGLYGFSKAVARNGSRTRACGRLALSRRGSMGRESTEALWQRSSARRRVGSRRFAGMFV